MKGNPIIGRFWDYVTPVVNPDDCAEWMAARYPAPKHYGLVRRGGPGGGRQMTAHRAAWELCHGPIPDGLCVLHHCDNPPCVAHLFLGTRGDNNRDRHRKGRDAKGFYLLVSYGATNGSAKLTADAVRLIRNSDLSAPRAALLYGVSDTTIRNVRKRLYWSHLED